MEQATVDGGGPVSGGLSGAEADLPADARRDVDVGELLAGYDDPSALAVGEGEDAALLSASVTAFSTPSASSVVSMVSSREAFCTPILTSIWRTS